MTQRREALARHARIRRATALLVGDAARAAAHADQITAALRAEAADDVLDAWMAERIVGLATHAARELGVEAPAWAEAAQQQAAHASASAGFTELIAIQVTRQLAAEGIPSIVLKGSPLAERVHGDAALRDASADTDILVPTDDLRRAEQLLRSHGWQPPLDAITQDGDLPDLHLALVGPGPAPMIEIHWRVQWYDREHHSRWLVSSAEQFKGLPVANAEGLLSVLLLCWARDGFHQLRLGADIAAWWSTFGVEHGAGAWAMFDESPLRRPLYIASQAASALLGTPPPPNPVDDRRARMAERIALVDRPANTRDAYSQVCLVDQLVCPAGTHRDRLRRSWLRDPATLRAEHPWLPSWAVPAGRVTSAARTTADIVPLLLRARR